MPFLGLLIAAGLLYDGAIFYSRWSRDRQAVRAQAREESEQARTIVKTLGDGVKILSFYAAPSTIARGRHTDLCYGVTGAATVRIEPPIDAVWPALTRCVQVSPRKDIEYKLIAGDGKGGSAVRSVTVSVR